MAHHRPSGKEAPALKARAKRGGGIIKARRGIDAFMGLAAVGLSLVDPSPVMHHQLGLAAVGFYEPLQPEADARRPQIGP